MLLTATIGYVAEAAWHHPDLSIGYAKVTVKLQTHRVRAVTLSDIELARRIDQVRLLAARRRITARRLSKTVGSLIHQLATWRRASTILADDK